MSKKYCMIGLIVFFLTLLMMTGCEYEVAQPQWEKDYTSPQAPEITRVEPPDSAVAGDNYITLYGDNFASSLEDNHVYFDNVPVDVITGNDTMLTVYRPDLVDDSITIKLNSYEADVVAEFDNPYKVTSVFERYGSFAENAQIAAFCISNDEMYVIMQTPVLLYKIDAQGERAFIDTVFVRAPRNIVINPDNEMVFLSNYRRVYKADPSTVDPVVVEWIDAGSGRYIVSGDYDQYGNFYFGGRSTDLRVISSIEDSTGQTTGLYPDNEIFDLTISGDYIYVLAETSPPEIGVMRHQVHSDGTVDAGDLLLSWADTGEFVELVPNSISMAENGLLYIGIENEEGVGTVLSLDPATGDSDVLYKNILPSYAVNLVSNDHYLYMLLGGEEWNILKIDVGF